MGYYTQQRDAIKARLESVSGIGKIYSSPQNVTNEANFKSRFVSGGVINTCWISRIGGTDNENGGLGSVDECDIITHTQADDTWEITLLYGFDELAPSETAYQLLADAIQDKFRFVQYLGGDMYEKSKPLQRTVSGLFQFVSGYMCHKAVWRLNVIERIVDTSPE